MSHCVGKTLPRLELIRWQPEKPPESHGDISRSPMSRSSGLGLGRTRNLKTLPPYRIGREQAQNNPGTGPEQPQNNPRTTPATLEQPQNFVTSGLLPTLYSLFFRSEKIEKNIDFRAQKWDPKNNARMHPSLMSFTVPVLT